MTSEPYVAEVIYPGERSRPPIRARQMMYTPFFGEGAEREQWEVELPVPDDARKRISDRLTRGGHGEDDQRPLIATRERRPSENRLSALPHHITVAAEGHNVTPDEMATTIADAVAEHAAAVRRADDLLVQKVTALLSDRDLTVEDWRNER